LRRDWQFGGIVFSDDIGMAAAESAGGVRARIDAHLDAGCDIVLVCAPSLVDESIAAVAARPPLAPERLAKLSARQHPDWTALTHSAAWRDTQQALRVLTSVKGSP
jgi:beta-N-acetylhexosaminidase